MSVDANYNSQFIQIDFKLLDNPDFLAFVGRAEFATYLILRRYICGAGGKHRLGLDRLYAEERKLAASIGGPRIAALLRLNDRTQVSRHLSSLTEQGIIQRIRTGRESIFILGEWHKPPGWDVSKEFYFLENRFGIASGDSSRDAVQAVEAVENSDVEKNPKSDVEISAHQTWRKSPHNNREPFNKELNTVNGVKLLPDLDIEVGEKEYLVSEMLAQLGDTHSKRFYELVASRIPASHILEVLAQIRADGAKSPARLFTYRMHQYALKRIKQGVGQATRAA